VCYGSVAGLLHPFGGKAVDVGCNVSYPAIGEPYWNRVAGKCAFGLGEDDANLHGILWKLYAGVSHAVGLVLSIIRH
jgi:hypothetical protein